MVLGVNILFPEIEIELWKECMDFKQYKDKEKIPNMLLFRPFHNQSWDSSYAFLMYWPEAVCSESVLIVYNIYT